MHVKSLNSATFIITNIQELNVDAAQAAHCIFYGDAEKIGSDELSHWCLRDKSRKVYSQHAEVITQDGQLCLLDLSGQTFINHATSPLGHGQIVKLSDGDKLAIGDFQIKVISGELDIGQPSTDALFHLMSLEKENTNLLSDDEISSSSGVAYPAAISEEPMNLLSGSRHGQFSQNPLAALEGRERASLLLETEDALSTSESPLLNRRSQQASGQLESDRAVIAPSHPINEQRSRDMDQHQFDDLERSIGEQLEERWERPDVRAVEHIAATPLVRGLNLDLAFQDSEEQQMFLEEAGRTLRAAIDGLRLLHQTQTDKSRYPLRDRRLQPIEDNPLRLGLSFEETAETMFSPQRSPVHLTAPEAVAEALKHQRQHQEAIEEAIEQALDAILAAFAPQALLKRFHAYRGGASHAQDDGNWAWDMYQHYYRELNSGRQQGFKKLFWEIFEQDYDQSVRRRQREET